MRISQWCLILIFFFSLACTKSQPDFAVIDEDNIPRPLFSGSTKKQLFTGNNNLTFKINGECDPKISEIKGTAIGTNYNAANMRELTVNDISLTCTSDGKFSFELKSLSNLGYTLTENSVYEIQLRGVTTAGMSKPSSILITYSTKLGGARPTLITSGSTGTQPLTTTNGFSARIRIGNKSNGDISNPATADNASLKTDSFPNGFKANVGVRVNY
jgi:hypothetical protein